MKCKICNKPIVEHIITTGYVGGIGLIHHKDGLEGNACFDIQFELSISDMVKE